MQNIEKQPISYFKIILLLIALIFPGVPLISSCSERSNQTITKPVPLGDKQALEQLAIAYRAQRSKLATTPKGLKPESKRQFIETVFQEAGYNYNLTLLQMAGHSVDFGIQLHKDLAELVILPQSGVNKEELASFNSQSEIKAINIVLDKLK